MPLVMAPAKVLVTVRPFEYAMSPCDGNCKGCCNETKKGMTDTSCDGSSKGYCNGSSKGYCDSLAIRICVVSLWWLLQRLLWQNKKRNERCLLRRLQQRFLRLRQLLPTALSIALSTATLKATAMAIATTTPKAIPTATAMALPTALATALPRALALTLAAAIAKVTCDCSCNGNFDCSCNGNCSSLGNLVLLGATLWPEDGCKLDVGAWDFDGWVCRDLASATTNEENQQKRVLHLRRCRWLCRLGLSRSCVGYNQKYEENQQKKGPPVASVSLALSAGSVALPRRLQPKK